VGNSKVLRRSCLAIAGIATAWGVDALPAQAVTDHTVDVTTTATLNSGESLANPHFLYVSNTSVPGPIPGIAGLPASNFAPLVNPSTFFSVVGHDDEDFLPIGPGFTVPSSMSYMLVGLAPNGDLVAGLNSTAAANAVAGNSSFDSLFPPGGNEASVIAALLNPGAPSDAALTGFAGGLSNNGNINSYFYFNDPFPAGGFDPKIDSLTLVDFGHGVTGAPVDSFLGTVDFSLSTPEPASLAVLGVPMLLLLTRRRRR
jgi:hypothetical protein